MQITETGSSLLYPLWNIWQPAFEKARPDIQLTTGSTGSGVGISDAIAGLVQIGSSDAYISDSQAAQNPDLLNIPLAISAQQVMYNLGSLDSQHLNLSGRILAGIYSGKIAYWNDPAIAAANPGVALPHTTIVPVRRTDGSGDTFIFTQYLSDSAASAWTAGYGTAISWPPVLYEVGGNGNQGVEQALKQTPGSIGYVGISWLAVATKDGLGYAALQNKAGSYELPAADTIAAAVAALAGHTPPNERISLIFAPGADSYPIINFEYAIVNRKQPSAQLASDLQALLNWAIDGSGGNAAGFLGPVSFQPLPPSVVALSQTQINEIAG